ILDVRAAALVLACQQEAALLAQTLKAFYPPPHAWMQLATFQQDTNRTGDFCQVLPPALLLRDVHPGYLLQFDAGIHLLGRSGMWSLNMSRPSLVISSVSSSCQVTASACLVTDLSSKN